MGTTIDIRLKRVNKTYLEGDSVAGVVIVTSKSEVRHEGISLTVEGNVSLQLSAKSVGLFEAFYNSIKPLQLVYCNVEMSKPGKLPSGKTEIPFEIALKPKGNKILYETYHGVFVNIQYSCKVDMKRPLLNKDLQKSLEFIVENKAQTEPAIIKPVPFTISPETLQNVQDRSSVPKFRVKGKLDSAACIITQPFKGELIVEFSAVAIKSIELQLVRVETCGCAEGYAKDATEIQNIQIGEGDVCRNVPIPIYMIFPRLFTCPTLHTNNFKVEFDVNIVIMFENDYLITENFPIKLTRT